MKGTRAIKVNAIELEKIRKAEQQLNDVIIEAENESRKSVLAVLDLEVTVIIEVV